nr:unnamed protein product [Spirometra erinaceieuropaei]
MPANQPNQLGGARTRATDLEEDSEDRRCDLRSQPHRCRQSENVKPANHNFAQSATPPHNRFQRVLDVSGYSGLKSDLLDIFGLTAPLERHLLSSPRLPLPPPLRRQLTLTILLTHHFHHPPPPPSSSRPLLKRRLLRATDTTTTSPNSRDEDQDYTCPHCDRTFTSHIGLVGHLRIHRTETGKPVREAPTYTHRTRLHCPHCPRTFRHCMDLFGHMRIQESGLDRTPDKPTTFNTSTVHNSTLVPFVHANTTTTASSVSDTDTAEFSCPQCPRTFTSRIGLIGHLRIHHTETGEQVPGAPTYTQQARLNCPHCPRTFRRRMGLFGHMRIHDDLR